MAAGGERRMLFDIRGKRKHVVRVVYAILALLMGASLFLVVGPVNIGSLVGSSSTSDAGLKVAEEQIERTEHRLRANPEDPDILLSLTRAQLNAARASTKTDESTRQPIVTAEAIAQYEDAIQTWDRYLKKAGNEPSPSLAVLVAGGAFVLAENSETYPEAFEHLEQTAAAQRVAAEARPSVGELTKLAAYEYLAGDFAAAEMATKQAESFANSKSQKKQISKQLEPYRKQGKELQKNKKAAEKAEKGKGKETLQNPLGGLGGTSFGAP